MNNLLNYNMRSELFRPQTPESDIIIIIIYCSQRRRRRTHTFCSRLIYYYTYGTEIRIITILRAKYDFKYYNCTLIFLSNET